MKPSKPAETLAGLRYPIARGRQPKYRDRHKLGLDQLALVFERPSPADRAGEPPARAAP